MNPTSESTTPDDGLRDAVRRAKVIRRCLVDALDDALLEVGEVLRRRRLEINKMVEAIHRERETTPRKRALARFARITRTKASTEAASPREAL